MLLLLFALVADTSHVVRIAVAPGESLRVVTAGEGEPVVMIPGLIGSAYSYRRVIARLAGSGRRAVVIEPLGVGRSSRPEDADYSLTAQADRIAAVFDTLGIRGAVVVAHSVAGSIALRLAYRRPAYVRAIVSIEGGPTEEATSAEFRRLLAFGPLLKMIDGSELMRRIVHKQLREAAADTSWITEEVLAGYTAPAAEDFRATVGAWMAMAGAREPERLTERLGAIACPVVLLLGAAPHKSRPPDPQIAALSDSVAKADVEWVAGAGHFIQEERPDAVVEAIARFFSAPVGQRR